MKLPVKVLGVTGTVQTGKSELRPVFEGLGWVFHDLNDPQCDLRAKGTARFDLYNTSFPGCLRDDGAKTAKFFGITPEFYQARVREDMELLVPIVRQLCVDAGSQPVALSWEYLPLIARNLTLDHTLLFISNRVVWMERLRARLKSRGVQGEVTDTQIHQIIEMLNVWPETVHAQVEQEMAGNFTEIDVSPADWGAVGLKAWLQKARGKVE